MGLARSAVGSSDWGSYLSVPEDYRCVVHFISLSRFGIAVDVEVEFGFASIGFGFVVEDVLLFDCGRSSKARGNSCKAQ